MMNIIVCIRQVLSTASIKIDQTTGVIKRSNVLAKMNFYDFYGSETSNTYMAVCLIFAVTFAIGDSILAEPMNLLYLLCIFGFGILLFLIAIYGTNMIRKMAAAVSILLIVGLLIIFIPNIIAQCGIIAENIRVLKKEAASFRRALRNGFLYGVYQLVAIGLFVQHAKLFKDKNFCLAASEKKKY